MPANFDADDRRVDPWEARQVDAAGSEAGAIGGRAGDEDLDPAERPVVESGEGEAEGFELAEVDLIDSAEHTGEGTDPLAEGFPPEREASPGSGIYGEADHEESSEAAGGDR